MDTPKPGEAVLVPNCHHDRARREAEAQECDKRAAFLRSGRTWHIAVSPTQAWCQECGCLIVGESIPC